MTPTDRILKIGTKLENDGLKAFVATTPTGHPAYFRACGLQIIPSEAEEIDTGHSCRLVITPLAASLSSLVTDLVNVLKAAPAGQKRFEAFVEEIKTKTFKEVTEAGEWEVNAAKGIVSAALKISDRSFSEPPRHEPDDWTMMDPFTGEIHEHRRDHWRKDHDFLSRYGRREIPRSARSIAAGASSDSTSGSADLTWIEVRAHLGVVVRGYWIPIGNASTLSDTGAQVELVKALRRKGLKPDIALTIIANARKRPKRNGR